MAGSWRNKYPDNYVSIPEEAYRILGMNRMDSLRWRYSSGWGHEAALLEIHASVHVKFRPMAVLAARGEALDEAPVRQPLEGAVDPTEAESLFHDFNIWNRWPFWTFPTISHHPTTFLFVVVLFKPLSKFGARGKM